MIEIGTTRPIKRAAAFPPPTVAAIEQALHELLIAIVVHDRKRPTAGSIEVQMYAVCDLAQTRFLPGEEFMTDPVGHSLREGVCQLGRTLFALTGSTDAMRQSCERVCRRDPRGYGLRASIIDHWWDGIGNDHDRWYA